MAPPRATDGPLPSLRASFTQAPDGLFDALAATCDGPAERVLRPAANVVECRMLMPPQATAGAILRYGGTIDDLPESVIRLSSERVIEGAQTRHILSAASFMAVPLAGGGTLHVVYPDPRMDKKVLRLLERLGGTAM
ncbi:hypothetical protein ACFQ3C_06735 [Seohaeicola saemankumensis]|uniref:Uncharacterized protein n=1 Tax=Seohaeicola saemankumensis TaxID=481181 RepID=A0ABW3TF65_9RHOB